MGLLCGHGNNPGKKDNTHLNATEGIFRPLLTELRCCLYDLVINSTLLRSEPIWFLLIKIEIKKIITIP